MGEYYGRADIDLPEDTAIQMSQCLMGRAKGSQVPTLAFAIGLSLAQQAKGFKVMDAIAIEKTWAARKES